MIVSEINPITFWMPTPFPLGLGGLNLAATKATFNTEDKDDVIQFADKYYHIIVKTDEISTEIIVDDITHTHTLYAFNEDGTVAATYDFAQVVTTHFRVTIGAAELSYLRGLTPNKGKYIFFAVVDQDDPGGALVYAVSDPHFIVDSTKRSTVIGYQSIREYCDILPDILMFIRLPAAFFQPETTEEVETSTTSYGSVTSMSGEVSTSSRLKTDALPNYWDRKIKLILKSHILQVRNGTYKQTEPASWRYLKPNYEFGILQAMLYLQNSTKRNVYATPTPE